MDNSRLYDLFNRYTSGNITASEELELAAMVIDPANEKTFRELEARYWEQLKDISDPLPGSAEESLQTILPGKVVPMRRKLVKMMAAASILLVVGLGSYLLFFNRDKQEEVVEIIIPKDVKAPSTNRAMITLADGRTVFLDSALNGELAVQGNVKLVKLANGQIAYQTASGEIVKELKYNTLSNPRGSKVIDMQLSDGSHVWLNAGSSVTYPIAFVGNERKVSITGEAYFEVAHNSTMPFTVSKGETSVQVLGTKFNVNAYDDESDIKITLLEGSVKVSKGNANNLLKPGQQAQITNDIKIISGVDIEQVMAWKNGKFQFGGAGIEEVMRQIARWYDVEVVYEVKPQDVHFRGGISRDVEASKVFKMLETTEAVHFRIEGKKVFVIR